MHQCGAGGFFSFDHPNDDIDGNNFILFFFFFFVHRMVQGNDVYDVKSMGELLKKRNTYTTVTTVAACLGMHDFYEQYCDMSTVHSYPLAYHGKEQSNTKPYDEDFLNHIHKHIHVSYIIYMLCYLITKMYKKPLFYLDISPVVQAQIWLGCKENPKKRNAKIHILFFFFFPSHMAYQ